MGGETDESEEDGMNMTIGEAHEYAEGLSSFIAELIPDHPILTEYFGSVWKEIDAKEKAYQELLKGRLR